MKRYIWGVLLLGCLLLVLPALAADDEEDDNGGGAVLDANLQWQLADAAWGRREYDDAAVLLTTFANANPDNENALEGLWRAYYAYKAYRPNPERCKKAFDKAMDACERWEQKYGDKDRVRLAASLWFRANLRATEGDRALGTRFLKDLIKRASGTRFDGDAYWTLAEWLYADGKNQEAIPVYQAYRKVVGPTDVAALAIIREIDCCVKLKDNQGAARAGQELLDGAFNWYGGYIYTYSLDAAKQLKAIGEEKLSRQIALKLIEKGPNYETIRNPAKTFLGENVSKRISIYPQFYDNYTTTNINVDARTKLEHTVGMDLLIRLAFVTKDEPFEGTLQVTPKQTMKTLPANMKVAEEGGKKICTTEFKAPDAAGNVTADTWFKFEGGEAPPETPMEGLVITRKWEKLGNTWGEATIRIQSSARWELFINLLNNKTSPDNVTPKPYYVYAEGKSFYYYSSLYDPTQGATFKFPVEVGANVQEYYPEVYIYRYINPPYTAAETNTANPSLDFRWFNIKLTSPKEFPCTLSGPSWQYVTVKEVIK